MSDLDPKTLRDVARRMYERSTRLHDAELRSELRIWAEVFETEARAIEAKKAKGDQ